MPWRMFCQPSKLRIFVLSFFLITGFYMFDKLFTPTVIARYEEAREEEKLRTQKEDFSDMVAEVHEVVVPFPLFILEYLLTCQEIHRMRTKGSERCRRRRNSRRRKISSSNCSCLPRMVLDTVRYGGKSLYANGFSYSVTIVLTWRCSSLVLFLLVGVLL